MSSLAYGFERVRLSPVETRIREWFHNNTGWMTRARVAEVPTAAPAATEVVPAEVHTAASDAQILFEAGIRPQSHAGQVVFDALAARQEADRLAAYDRDQALNAMHDRGIQTFVG